MIALPGRVVRRRRGGREDKEVNLDVLDPGIISLQRRSSSSIDYGNDRRKLRLGGRMRCYRKRSGGISPDSKCENALPVHSRSEEIGAARRFSPKMGKRGVASSRLDRLQTNPTLNERRCNLSIFQVP